MFDYSRRNSACNSGRKRFHWIVICLVAVLVAVLVTRFYAKRDDDVPVEDTAASVTSPARAVAGGSAANSSVPPNAGFEEPAIVDTEYFFPELQGVRCLRTKSQSFPKDFFYDSDRGGPVWDDMRTTVERTRDYAKKVCAIQSINQGPKRCECEITPLQAGAETPAEPIEEVVVISPVSK